MPSFETYDNVNLAACVICSFRVNPSPSRVISVFNDKEKSSLHEKHKIN